MDEFNFLFTFYGLLLGLALVNVATGLADLWRGRDDIRLGICGPMLALAIASFTISQWYLAWVGRAVLTVGPWQMLVCVGITLPVVFVSQAMIPKQTEKWQSLDAYYLSNRAVLLGVLSISPFVSVLSNWLFYRGAINFYDVMRILFTIAIPVGLIGSRNRWAHAGGLGLMAAFYLLTRMFRLLG